MGKLEYEKLKLRMELDFLYVLAFFNLYLIFSIFVMHTSDRTIIFLMELYGIFLVVWIILWLVIYPIFLIYKIKRRKIKWLRKSSRSQKL